MYASEMEKKFKLTKITPNYLDNPTADDGGREAVEEGEGDGGSAVLDVGIRCREFLETDIGREGGCMNFARLVQNANKRVQNPDHFEDVLHEWLP